MPETRNAVSSWFHVGLYAADFGRSVQFYQTLFDIEPIKRFAEYARFECEEARLVLTVKSHRAKRGGALNHVGLRLTDSAKLVAIQRRLEESGVATQRQDGVECCYAKQTKFWVTDPDCVLWEFYVLEEDIDHAGLDDPPPPREDAEPAGATWEHRLADHFPERLPYEDGTLDEVQLLGTLNAMVDRGETARRMSEVLRVLRPGGRVIALGLVGDKPFSGRLDLPGQAARCEYLPVEQEPLEIFAQVGLEQVFYEKLHDVNCMRVPGIDLRSFRIVGRRAAVNSEAACPCIVMYRGPFASATGDHGLKFPRGERVEVSAEIAAALRRGPAASQFIFLAASPPLPLVTLGAGCCG